MADLMPVWLTYCPHDGWEEHETRAEAEIWLDRIVDALRDEAAEGWHEAAEDARLVEARVVRRLELRVTECLDGWDYRAEGVLADVEEVGDE